MNIAARLFSLSFGASLIIVWPSHFYAYETMKSLVLIVALLVCVSLAVVQNIKRRDRLVVGRCHLAMFLFLAWTCLSLSWTEYPAAHALELVAIWSVVFFIGFSSFDDREDSFLTIVFAVVAFASFVYAALQYSGTDHPLLVDRFASRISGNSRAFSFFGNPNVLGGILVAMLPLVTAQLLSAVRKRQSLQTLVFTIALAAISIQLVLSETRASIVAAALSFGLFFGLLHLISRKGRFKITAKRILIFALVCAGTVIILANMGVVQRLLETRTLAIRAIYVDASVDMISDSPVLGHGKGSFAVLYPEYGDRAAEYVLGETHTDYRVEHAHNEHLELMVELGVVGYCLFLWLVLEAILVLYRRGRLVDFAIIAAIVGLLVDGLGTQNLRNVVVGSMFWLLLGLAARRVHPSDGYSCQLLPLTPLAVSLIVSIALVLRVPQTHRAEESFWMAIGLYEQMRFRDAESLLRDGARERGRLQKPALYYAANSARLSNSLEEAQFYYRRLFELDPGFLNSNFEVGLIELASGTYEEARRRFATSASRNNMQWKAMYGLAVLAMRDGDFAGAGEQLEAIVEVWRLGVVATESERVQVARLMKAYEDQLEKNR